MRLSRDKVNRLAHSVADALATLDDVEFIEDPNSIRMEARRIGRAAGRGSEDRPGSAGED